MVDQRARADLYEKRHKIGKGAFGDVFLAIDRRNNQKCVLKSIKLARQNDWQREATRREMKLMAALNHPFIVPCVDQWTDNQHTVNVVLGFCEGGDLGEWLTKTMKDKVIPEQQLKDWLSQLLLALWYLEQEQVIHRDIKLANIFLHADGYVQLGDFGLCSVKDADDPTADHDQSLVGTPHCMSPELLSQRGYSYPTDVWSLGCVMHELSSHNPPFTAFNLNGLIDKIKYRNPGKLPASYSQDWCCLVRTMLRKEPDQRPSPLQLMQHPFLAKTMAATVRMAKVMVPDVMLPDLDLLPEDPEPPLLVQAYSHDTDKDEDTIMEDLEPLNGFTGTARTASAQHARHGAVQLGDASSLSTPFHAAPAPVSARARAAQAAQTPPRSPRPSTTSAVRKSANTAPSATAATQQPGAAAGTDVSAVRKSWQATESLKSAPSANANSGLPPASPGRALPGGVTGHRPSNLAVGATTANQKAAGTPVPLSPGVNRNAASRVPASQRAMTHRATTSGTGHVNDNAEAHGLQIQIDKDVPPAAVGDMISPKISGARAARGASAVSKSQPTFTAAQQQKEDVVQDKKHVGTVAASTAHAPVHMASAAEALEARRQAAYAAHAQRMARAGHATAAGAGPGATTTRRRRESAANYSNASAEADGGDAVAVCSVDQAQTAATASHAATAPGHRSASSTAGGSKPTGPANAPVTGRGQVAKHATGVRTSFNSKATASADVRQSREGVRSSLTYPRGMSSVRASRDTGLSTDKPHASGRTVSATGNSQLSAEQGNSGCQQHGDEASSRPSPLHSIDQMSHVHASLAAHAAGVSNHRSSDRRKSLEEQIADLIHGGIAMDTHLPGSASHDDEMDGVAAMQRPRSAIATLAHHLLTSEVGSFAGRSDGSADMPHNMSGATIDSASAVQPHGSWGSGLADSTQLVTRTAGSFSLQHKTSGIPQLSRLAQANNSMTAGQAAVESAGEQSTMAEQGQPASSIVIHKRKSQDQHDEVTRTSVATSHGAGDEKHAAVEGVMTRKRRIAASLAGAMSNMKAAQDSEAEDCQQLRRVTAPEASPACILKATAPAAAGQHGHRRVSGGGDASLPPWRPAGQLTPVPGTAAKLSSPAVQHSDVEQHVAAEHAMILHAGQQVAAAAATASFHPGVGGGKVVGRHESSTTLTSLRKARQAVSQRGDRSRQSSADGAARKTGNGTVVSAGGSLHRTLSARTSAPGNASGSALPARASGPGNAVVFDDAGVPAPRVASASAAGRGAMSTVTVSQIPKSPSKSHAGASAAINIPGRTGHAAVSAAGASSYSRRVSDGSRIITGPASRYDVDAGPFSAMASAAAAAEAAAAEFARAMSRHSASSVAPCVGASTPVPVLRLSGNGAALSGNGAVLDEQQLTCPPLDGGIDSLTPPGTWRSPYEYDVSAQSSQRTSEVNRGSSTNLSAEPSAPHGEIQRSMFFNAMFNTRRTADSEGGITAGSRGSSRTSSVPGAPGRRTTDDAAMGALPGSSGSASVASPKRLPDGTGRRTPRTSRSSMPQTTDVALADYSAAAGGIPKSRSSRSSRASIPPQSPKVAKTMPTVAPEAVTATAVHADEQAASQTANVRTQIPAGVADDSVIAINTVASIQAHAIALDTVDESKEDATLHATPLARFKLDSSASLAEALPCPMSVDQSAVTSDVHDSVAERVHDLLMGGLVVDGTQRDNDGTAVDDGISIKQSISVGDTIRALGVVKGSSPDERSPVANLATLQLGSSPSSDTDSAAVRASLVHWNAPARIITTPIKPASAPVSAAGTKELDSVANLPVMSSSTGGGVGSPLPGKFSNGQDADSPTLVPCLPSVMQVNTILSPSKSQGTFAGRPSPSGSQGGVISRREVLELSMRAERLQRVINTAHMLLDDNNLDELRKVLASNVSWE